MAMSSDRPSRRGASAASIPARHCASPASSTSSPISIGRRCPTTTPPTRTMSRRKRDHPIARSTTTGSCSTDSRSRWCWPRIGRPRVSRLRWSGSNTGTEPHVTDLHAQRSKAFVVEKPEKPRGNAEKAFAAAEVRHEAEYFIPTEHHNPMELFASTAIWDGDGKLTVYDKTQGVQNVQRYLCGVFEHEAGRRPRHVALYGRRFRRGPAPAIPGRAGGAGSARAEATGPRRADRAQMYALGYRPATIERLALGAKAGGTLDAIMHEAIAVTSQFEEFSRNDTGWADLLYKSPNTKFVHKLARLDVPTSSDMRAPGAATGVYALECAMDELAVALKIDPVRAAAAMLLRPRPERGPSLYQQAAARMLPAGRGGVRLGQAQTRSRARCATAAIWSAGAWRPAYGKRCRCRPRSASC